MAFEKGFWVRANVKLRAEVFSGPFFAVWEGLTYLRQEYFWEN
jgi:hypothetical protein